MREKIIWIIAGVAFVTLAFLIPWDSQGIWPNVLSGTAAAFIFVIAFAWRWVREISSVKKRLFIYGSLAILIISTSTFAVYQYKISVFQGNILEMHRSNIDRAVTRAYIHRPLQKTLREFYRDNNQHNIGKLFQAHFDSLVSSDSIYHYPTYKEGDRVMIWVSKLSQDSIVLVAETKASDGWKTDFENISGNNGNIQAKGILTQKGIGYEREN